MKFKNWKLFTVLLAVLTLVAATTLTVYAYFSTRVYVYTEDGGKQQAHLGMNLQLLFGKLDDTLPNTTKLLIPYYENNGTYNVYHAGGEDSPTFNPEASWGSPQNPYIIANERHLQNLSVLQSIGYFDLMYISDNFGTDNAYNGGIRMPYFLVCKEDGTPVVINGSDIGTIRPIGSAEHPFIGVIGGAFATGSATVGTTGKTTTVSAFHNVQVQTNTDQTDVGLFGYIGYLGNAPADGATEDYLDENGNPVQDTNGNNIQVLIEDFEGASSVVQNLTLSDIQIKVNEPSVPEEISKFFTSLFGTNHRFSYTGATDATKVPHETHHIGIFAGHVSYAKIEYISVYYSAGNICAIDLLDTVIEETSKTPNYHSTTGIVGFMHNMNSAVKNQEDANGYTGNCLLGLSGTSSEGVALNPGGVGTGGGAEIGLGRGYVMAETLYNGCHYIAENQALGDRVWKYTSGSTTGFAMMVFENATGTGYVDQDGTAATIADGVATIKGIKYKSYIVRELVSGTGTATDPYVYRYMLNGTTEVAQKDIFELPQTIWQYATSAPTDNNTPTWVDAVMLYETGSGTGKYTLSAGINAEGTVSPGVAVTVTAKSGGGYSATIDGTTIYNDNASQVASISNVIFYRVGTGGKFVCSTTPTGAIVAPYVFREKPLLIRAAKTMFGTELCIESTEGLTLGSNELGNFYFYDGVFTFALSTADDTIEATWENDDPDQIVLGENQDASWEQGPYESDYFSVVAFLTQIKSVAELDAAIVGGKEIFVGYYVPDDANNYNSWQSGNLSVMSLYETDTNADEFFSEHDQFDTPAFGKTFFSSTELTELTEELNKDPDKNANLISLINNGAQVLNLESAKDLATLRQQFKIKPSGGNNAYTFTGTSADQYQLGLLERSFWFFGTQRYYSIWSGKSTNYPTGGTLGTDSYTHTFDNTAELEFDSTTRTFKLKYTTRDTSRYVYYDASASKFKGQGTAGTTSGLSLYVIEDMTSIATGHVVYNPTGGVTADNSFSADEYILWPKAVMTQNGTLVDGTLNAALPYDAADTKTDDTNATNNVYKTYQMVGLSELIAGEAGWQDGQGSKLDKTDLSKKFTMQKAIQFGASLKIPGIPNIQIDNNSVIAPVGPGGASANIPTGSIAFRINKTGTSTIRVIVSVPVSQFFDGEVPGESLYNTYDYYLGLWKTEDLNDDSWQLNTFNQTSAVQKFELPRSRPYAPGTTAAQADYILVERGGSTYRCYLNGERVLVGYEFTVQEAGTYILGTAIGRTSVIGGVLGSLIGNVTEPDEQYPMEIVYCSADGTASPGSDGTASSIYGSIDYVYDYEGKIVHVQDYNDSVSGDYTRYYNSNCVTHTKNDTTTTDTNGNSVFVNIQDIQACVQRTIVDGKIVLNITVYSTEEADAVLFYCRTAGVDPDQVVITVGERPTS